MSAEQLGFDSRLPDAHSPEAIRGELRNAAVYFIQTIFLFIFSCSPYAIALFAS